MEKMFQAFHANSKHGLSDCDNVIKDLAAQIHSKFPKYDLKDIKRFVLARSTRRMRVIQVEYFKLKESLRSKRKKIELGFSNIEKK